MWIKHWAKNIRDLLILRTLQEILNRQREGTSITA